MIIYHGAGSSHHLYVVCIFFLSSHLVFTTTCVVDNLFPILQRMQACILGPKCGAHSNLSKCPVKGPAWGVQGSRSPGNPARAEAPQQLHCSGSCFSLRLALPSSLGKSGKGRVRLLRRGVESVSPGRGPPAKPMASEGRAIRSKFTKNGDHEDERQVEGEDQETVFRNIRQRPGRSG